MKLILGNITETAADAIVVPTHSDMKISPGIRAAVFRAADAPALEEACARIGRCRIGHAVVTPSCGLPCRFLIHAAGPGYYSGHKSDRILFSECYLKAFSKAAACHCRSVAVPLMFSGEYHIPRAQALQLVCRAVRHFESAHSEPEILLVLYRESIYRLAQKIFEEQETQSGVH